EGALGLYRTQGLHVLYHGDEAVVDVSRFSLEGRPIRKVRQSVHRLQREGYTAETRSPSTLTGAEREQLEELARAWRGTEPERGFGMALDTLFRLYDEHPLFPVRRAAT